MGLTEQRRYTAKPGRCSPVGHDATEHSRCFENEDSLFLRARPSPQGAVAGEGMEVECQTYSRILARNQILTDSLMQAGVLACPVRFTEMTALRLRLGQPR